MCLGVITTRQQHVNKEDDCSLCAFVFPANQPAAAAALCFVQLKTNRAASLSASRSELTSLLKSILLFLFLSSFVYTVKVGSELGAAQ